MDLLFIEDSESDYLLMTAVLKRAGLVSQSVRTDEEAGLAHHLSTQRWDAVISDFGLPGFSATQALMMVKQMSPDTPFLIVSGAIGEETAVEAMLAGADDYIMKSNLRRLPPALLRSIEAAAARRDRASAQTALTQAHTQLNAVFTATPVAIFTVDAEQRVRLWSPAMAALTGVPRHAQVGRCLDLGTPAANNAVLPHIVTALAGKSCRNLPLNLQCPAGRIDILLSAMTLDPTHHEGCVVAFSDVTSLRATEARLRESETQLRELTAHAERVREQERSEIAREIHDDLGAILTRIRADIGVAKQRCAQADVSPLLESVESLVASFGQAIARIAQSLRPPILDFGIVPAIEWQAREFAQHSGIAVAVTLNDEAVTLDLEQSTAIFRVFQEALTNILKHAKATQVRVEIFANKTTLTLEIRDNGVGLSKDALAKPASFGIRGMMERIRQLGGWMDASSAADGGTTLMICIPLRRQRLKPVTLEPQNA